MLLFIFACLILSAMSQVVPIATWSRLASFSVSPREGSVMIFNSSHSIITGGSNPTGLNPGIVSIDLDTLATNVGGPTSVASLPYRDMAVVVIPETAAYTDYKAYAFFGSHVETGKESNLVWGWNGDTWNLVTVSSDYTPPVRTKSTANYLHNCGNTGIGCIILSGGTSPTLPSTNRFVSFWVHESPPRFWQPGASGAYETRHSHVAFPNPSSDTLFIYGGTTWSGIVSKETFSFATGGYIDDAVPSEMENLPVVLTTVSGALTPGTSSGQPAGLAFDGVLGGANSQCATSGVGNNPFLRINLGSTPRADKLYIYWRADSGALNRGFRVFYSNTSAADSATELLHPYSDSIYNPTILETGGVYAQYWFIRVFGTGRQVSVCEFQIFRRISYRVRSLDGTNQNIALNRPAAQSSIGINNFFKYSPDLAVNNLVAVADDYSRTQDNIYADVYPNAQVWWRVDFGRTMKLTEVAITDASTHADMGKNTEIYVGNNMDYAMNTKCWEGDIYTFRRQIITQCAGVQGRFLHVRKRPSTCVQCTNRGAYENMIMLSEVVVRGERSLYTPLARSGASVTMLGAYAYVFGGTDANGFRLSDVVVFDTHSVDWLKPLVPVGSAPSGRAYAVMGVLPHLNSAVAGLSALPANRLIAATGSGPVDLLGDASLLTFPQCPALPLARVESLQCREGGTVCRYVCRSGYYSLNKRTSDTVFCGPDGVWEGNAELCSPDSTLLPPAVILGVQSAPAELPGSLRATWTATNPGAASDFTGFVVSARLPVWESYFPASVVSAEAAAEVAGWSLFVPSGSTYASIHENMFKLTDDGRIGIQSGTQSDFTAQSQTGTIVTHEWPLGASVNPATNNWFFETELSFLYFTSRGPRDYSFIGIGIFDASTGLLGYFAGLRREPGTIDFGGRTLGTSTTQWLTTPNTPNQPNIGGTVYAFLRLEVNNTRGNVRTCARWREDEAFSCLPWQSIANMKGGAIPSASNIRLALVSRSANAHTTYGEYKWVRAGLTASSEVLAGSSITVAGNVREAIVSRLTPGVPYRLSVVPLTALGAGPAAVFGNTLPATVAVPQTYNASALILVSVNKPCTMSSQGALGNGQEPPCFIAFNGNVLSVAPYGVAYTLTGSTASHGEYIQVDLLQSTVVREIELITIMASPFPSQTEGFQLWVSNSPGLGFLRGEQCDPSILPTTMQGINQRVVQCRSAKSLQSPIGRYVTYRALAKFPAALREMKVFTSPSCPIARTPGDGANNVVGTSCDADAPYGSICVQSCEPGFVAVAGDASAICNGAGWTGEPLVCAPVCGDLVAPSFADTEQCQQTLYQESFSQFTGSLAENIDRTVFGDDAETPGNPLLDSIPEYVDVVRSAWKSLEMPPTQYLLDSSMWGFTRGALASNAQAPLSVGVHAVVASSAVATFRGSFDLRARIRTSTAAGLIFRVRDRDNMYRYSFDVRSGMHMLERFQNGEVLTITEKQMLPPLSSSIFHTVRITQSTTSWLVSIYVDGRLVFQLVDSTFSQGTFGVFALQRAEFKDFDVSSACSSACIGATPGSVCRFGCETGLLAEGPVQRTCVKSGSVAVWSPAPLAEPLVCTLPPPVIYDTVRSVPENSPRNAIVGDPVPASSSSAEFTVQYAISAGNIGNTFYIDSCSGQIKVRYPLLDFETRSQYILTIRAFVLGFDGAEAFASVTVNVEDVNEAPFFPEPLPVLSVEELAPAGTLVHTFVATDPEGMALNYSLLVDSTGGAFVLSPSGELRVAPGGPLTLDFETGPTSFFLTVRASELTAGPNAFPLYTTATFSLLLEDANDAPIIPPNQLIALNERDANQAAGGLNGKSLPLEFGDLVAYDPDSLTGQFGSNVTYTICGNVPQSGGQPLFDVISGIVVTDEFPGDIPDEVIYVDRYINTPHLRLLRLPTPSFASMTPMPFYDGDIIRTSYTICLRGEDDFGGVTERNVTVKVSADVPDPIIEAFNVTGTGAGAFSWELLPPTGYDLSTAHVIISGSGFRSGPAQLQFTQPSIGVLIAVNCTVLVFDTELLCPIPGGQGKNLLVNVAVTGHNAIWRTDAPEASYVAFVVDDTNDVVSPTTGGVVVEVHGTGFGTQIATHGLRPTVFFYTSANPSVKIPCRTLSVPLNESNTVIRCMSDPGQGTWLDIEVNIGGVTRWSTSTSFSYETPTITSMVPKQPSVQLHQLDTAGGEELIVTGTNFGPSHSPVNLMSLRPGSFSQVIWPCVHDSVDPQHVLVCTTSADVGFNFRTLLLANANYSPEFFPVQMVNGTAYRMGYRAPVITGLTDNNNVHLLDTRGGELISVEGLNFGPIGTTASVYYGPPSSPFQFVIFTCTVSSLSWTGVSTLECRTVLGVGANLDLSIRIGGQDSNFLNASLSYAPPRIFSFEGTGANSVTEGYEVVRIHGDFFGNSRFRSELEVSYYMLMESTGEEVPFLDVPCEITEEHITLECLTVPGAGKNIRWTVSVAGQDSLQPTTAYQVPSISSVVVRDAGGFIVDPQALDVNGGQQVTVTGLNFGPSSWGPLNRTYLQSVTFGPVGLGYTLVNASVVDHRTLVGFLPPGTGRGMQLVITVADQRNQLMPAGTAPDAVLINYALPAIKSLSPAKSSTYNDPTVASPNRVTLAVTGIPFTDATTLAVAQLGLGTSARIVPLQVPLGPQSIAAATNPDKTVNVSFVVPVEGVGAEVPVRIRLVDADAAARGVFSDKSRSAPAQWGFINPVISEVIVTKAQFYVPSATPSASTTSTGTLSASATSTSSVSASSSSTVTATPSSSSSASAYPTDSVSPTVSSSSSASSSASASGTPSWLPSASPSRSPSASPSALPTHAENKDAIPCPFPANDPLWSCTSNSILQLTILGSNLGSPSAASASGASLVLDFLASNTTFYGERWSEEDIYVHSWTHGRIVAFVGVAKATIRLRIISPSFDGSTTVTQQIVRTVAENSPEILGVVGPVNNVPTIGGSSSSPVTVTVLHMLAGYSAEIWVGDFQATILFAPHASVAAMINAKLNGGSGPISIDFVPPPGQGQGVPIRVIRVSPSNERDGSNTGYTINYARPLIYSVDVYSSENDFIRSVSLDSDAMAYQLHARSPLLTAATDGTHKIVIHGQNLGVNPVVAIADGFELSASAGEIHPCNLPNLHNCYQMDVPPGEGDGLLVHADGLGYRLILSAGSVNAQPLRFQYEPPVVTSIVSSSPLGFPSEGGVRVSIKGRNFGERRDGRPDSSILVAVGEWDAVGFVECMDPERISHYLINCTLPASGGANLEMQVQVEGLSSRVIEEDETLRSVRFSYNTPAVASVESDNNTPAGRLLQVVSTNSSETMRCVVRDSTAGGAIVTLTGSNFGLSPLHYPLVGCIFLSWAHRDTVFMGPQHYRCNNWEDFLGEGELPASNIMEWTHSSVTFKVPEGLGNKDILVFARGALSAVNPRLCYSAPEVYSIAPLTFDTEGGDLVEIRGRNFGPALRDTSNPSLRFRSAFLDHFNATLNPVPGVSLSDAASLPTAVLAVVAHRGCSTSFRDVLGSLSGALVQLEQNIALQLSSCGGAIIEHSHERLIVRSPAGVGVNKTIQVVTIDSAIQSASTPLIFRYAPPQVSYFSPNILYMRPAVDTDISPLLSFDIVGRNFGNGELADAQGWSEAERFLEFSVGAVKCVQSRRRREDGQTVLSCAVSPSEGVAGRNNVTVVVAGQSTFVDVFPFNSALLVVCYAGSFGRVGETCVACPQGADCPGYEPGLQVYEQRFRYPVPKPGWYNLNSSDIYSRANGNGASMMDSCPPGWRVGDRDVCIVPCDPADACLGDNICADGYTSKAPEWRCSSCASGFYKRAGECIRCPDSPASLFVGFALLVIIIGAFGFYLNKKQVNIAVLSIGIDFFQVLAIFSNSKVEWPASIKELFHILSAFNLNLEIVAPECLIPDVDFKQKFYAVMLIPICVLGLLGLVFCTISLYRIFIAGTARKHWFTHRPALVSSSLVLFYIMYLYLTRTIMDVFNCAPTVPDDGFRYLQVVFERCDVAGGTQRTLLPFAITGLIIYTLGYPSFIGWTLYRNHETVMLDQLLRAKGVGHDKLTNPTAHDFRRMYGRSYFQFRPDTWFWILAILVRKLLIAITAVIFNRNSSFQMAACLLILFVAYAAQTSVHPYMAPGDYEDVLESHMRSSFSSNLHARLRQQISSIETRGKKKSRRNVLHANGTVNAKALFGMLSLWLFNYNTVEEVLLFAAIIVCLMGIMFESNSVSGNLSYPGSADAVTSVVIVVVSLAIIYFVCVLVAEVYIYLNEQRRANLVNEAFQKRVSKDSASISSPGMRNSMDLISSKLGLSINTKANSVLSPNASAAFQDSSNFASANPMSPGFKEQPGFIVGSNPLNASVESTNNPLFMMGGNEGISSTWEALGKDFAGARELMQLREPPSQDVWLMFQQAFAEQSKRLMDAQSENATLKKSIRKKDDMEQSAPGNDSPRKSTRSQFAQSSTNSPASRTQALEAVPGVKRFNMTQLRKK